MSLIYYCDVFLQQRLRNVQKLLSTFPYSSQNDPLPWLTKDKRNFRTINYNGDDDTIQCKRGCNYRKLKVYCPNCGRSYAAMLSVYTALLEEAHICLGNQYSEMDCDCYTFDLNIETSYEILTYGSKCVRCNCVFVFRVYYTEF